LCTHAAITCGDLGVIIDGVIRYSTNSPYSFGTTATHSCLRGYGLASGDLVRTCGGDGLTASGVWNGTAGICDGTHSRLLNYHHINLNLALVLRKLSIYSLFAAIFCPVLQALSNGQILYTSVGNSMVGFEHSASFSCDSGYYISDASDRECDGNGTSNIGYWTGTQPTCTRVTCPSLPLVVSGQISYSPDMTDPHDVGTVASYTCDSGFGATTTSTQRMCVSSSAGPGEWSSTATTCQGQLLIIIIVI